MREHLPLLAPNEIGREQLLRARQLMPDPVVAGTQQVIPREMPLQEPVPVPALKTLKLSVAFRLNPGLASTVLVSARGFDTRLRERSQQGNGTRLGFEQAGQFGDLAKKQAADGSDAPLPQRVQVTTGGRANPVLVPEFSRRAV